MLTIREAQMSVFRRQAVVDFEQQMLQHIRAAFPIRYDKLGESDARELIRAAIRAGARYKITARGAVAVLVELMLVYGEEFELSPDPAWAHSILTHPTLPAHLKVDTIHERFESQSQGRLIVPLEEK